MTPSQSHQPAQGAMRSVSDVAAELGLPLYRLCSWESLYPVFRTEQGDGGERYYDAHAVAVVRNIARLLYQEGAKSHEIVPLLRQEGIVAPAPMETASEGSEEIGRLAGTEEGGKAVPSSAQLEELRQENARLNDRLEEFGHIALSLKTLDDENASLKAALEQARSATAGQGEKAAYVDELEMRLLTSEDLAERQAKELEALRGKLSAGEGQQAHLDALKARVAELETDQARSASLREEFESERAELSRQHEALKAENRTLREAQTSRSHEEAERARKSVEHLDALKARLAELESAQARSASLRKEFESEQAELRRQHEALKAENRTLREAQSSRSHEEAEQARKSAERVDALEAERHGLVQKLEQSVLIMQSLEDENLRHKRSLKESEAAEERNREQQHVQAERLKALESENAVLKQDQAGLAEERERHGRGLERIRNLESDVTTLRQKLAVREEQSRAQEVQQKGLNQLLEGILAELAQMKKTLTD